MRRSETAVYHVLALELMRFSIPLRLLVGSVGFNGRSGLGGLGITVAPKFWKPGVEIENNEIHRRAAWLIVGVYGLILTLCLPIAAKTTDFAGFYTDYS